MSNEGKGNLLERSVPLPTSVGSYRQNEDEHLPTSKVSE